jgi:hypothetical protein
MAPVGFGSRERSLGEDGDSGPHEQPLNGTPILVALALRNRAAMTGRFRPKPGIQLPRLAAAKQSFGGL